MMLSPELTASTARSSLEEMLDSLRKRDEKPKDTPPALPVRPTSKARLPSARRSLPINFKIGNGEAVPEYLPLPNGSSTSSSVQKKNGGNIDNNKFDHGNGYIKKEEIRESVGFKHITFGSSKKLSRKDTAASDDSPYARKKETEELNFDDNERMLKENGDCEPSSAPSSLAVPTVDFDCGDNIGYVLKKKLRVWCLLSDGRWELGSVQSNSGDDAIVLLPDDSIVTVSLGNLLPANPGIIEGVNDLIQLSYLNEPSVLHNLQYRYSNNMIYTKAGPVLVAVNPFKGVPIFGNEFVSAYRQKALEDPHVYAIADTAFTGMMRDEVNQSIIISGESGAGKTETAKIAMQYLSTLGGADGIEHEILQTNCILEAFGNAKTSRNDNSSRFGKLIEIHFSTTGKICGAKIQTFLLEKSRVVQLAKGERTYHIFYQLCAGAPSDLKEKLNLKMASEYNYLRQSDCLTIDDVDDAGRFHILMEALDIVQICKEDQENIFTVLAALLWLGNISFQVIDNENHVEVVEDEAVTSVASLMGCDAQDLRLALSTRQIQAGKDTIVQKLTSPQAIDTRDALAKSIYACLFDWLVQQINKSLGVGKSCTGRSISILDIYGFESFKKNSFEQFCINYANERLQQHFNRHLFKLEQEEYTQDGIDWTKVDFEDNQDCLNLFEKKPLGLLSLLDEESNFPRATDLTFANKLKQHLNTNPCFKGERGGAFSVCHYAGEVLYQTNGFLEKNRDPLHSGSIHLLSSCSCQLLHLFASSMQNPSPVKPVTPLRRLSASDSQKQSVGTKFKGQLFKLMQRLEDTTPHFIRCIKPNSRQLPGMYEKDLVLQQLRCCGVLEVVRISRSGYPTRMTHQQFARRYGFLLVENVASQDPLSISVSILQQFNVHPEMYQVGYTKLFFRTGQIAVMEDARKRVLQGALMLQKCFRRYQALRQFQETKRGLITLQSYVRGANIRKQYRLLIKQEQAVLIIQKLWKRKIARKMFLQRQRAVICLQSATRGWLVRRYLDQMKNLETSNADSSEAEEQLDGEFSEQQLDEDVSEQEDLELSHAQVDSSVLAELESRALKAEAALARKEEEIAQVDASVLAELESRALKAEAALARKEEENAILQQHLTKLETRWSEYETKMKSMEETWQRQMTSLQVNLAAAKRRLEAEDRTPQNGRFDISLSPSPSPYYDSDDTPGTRTPDGSTPVKFLNHNPDAEPIQEFNNVINTAVSPLEKEFEQRKQVFEDDAQFIVEVKTGQVVSSVNPVEELRKLKHRFQTWKKEYKIRLRETKATLHKLGSSEVDRKSKKWWGKRSMRLT
ncbi:hypothetical protein MKX03_014521 [Papaver bracteatum]|nr:hypothetical protein MKX03_014521 [Papaver bracteatum]